MTTTSNVQCRACLAFLNETVAQTDRQPCPHSHCGSVLRIKHIFASERFDFKERMTMKTKRPSLRGKAKTCIEQIVGEELLYRRPGSWCKKVRIIDHEHDYYLEQITDSQTGKIIHYDEGRLSEHRGHGFAGRRRR